MFSSRFCVVVMLGAGPLAALPSAQAGFPPPPVPVGNPQTPDKVLLGKALFWDEQLSSTRTMACGTCHVFAHGGADPRPAVAPGRDGIEGTDDDVRGSAGVVRHDRRVRMHFDDAFGLQPRVTARRAPSVVNAAYAAELFVDGRAGGRFLDPVSGAVVLPQHAALESQAAVPPVSEVEMAHFGRSWTEIAADLPRLRPLALASNVPAALQQFVAGQTYASLFQRVFGTPAVTPVRIVFAIAAYQRTLVSDQSRYDLYLAGRVSLDAAEVRGLEKFKEFCLPCHHDIEPSSSGPVEVDYRNIGVRPVDEDVGRFAVTGDVRDRGRFRVPGLRNVALRAPYFHNGSALDLEQILDFYSRGGDFADNRDPLMDRLPGHIDNFDRVFLRRFLEALTDPRVQQERPPFDRPTLWSESAAAPVRVGEGTGPVGGRPPRIAFAAPGFAGRDFELGVDRVPAGIAAVLLLDVETRTRPLRVLGLDLHLALTPALVVLPAPRPTWGRGPDDGRVVFRLRLPPTGGVAFAGEWLALDGRGPSGLTSSGALSVPVF
ncbi:MAG: cytochrome c peroxidase [Planctomycetota bacterium]